MSLQRLFKRSRFDTARSSVFLSSPSLRLLDSSGTNHYSSDNYSCSEASLPFTPGLPHPPVSHTSWRVVAAHVASAVLPLSLSLAILLLPQTPCPSSASNSTATAYDDGACCSCSCTPSPCSASSAAAAVATTAWAIAHSLVFTSLLFSDELPSRTSALLRCSVTVVSFARMIALAFSLSYLMFNSGDCAPMPPLLLLSHAAACAPALVFSAIGSFACSSSRPSPLSCLFFSWAAPPPPPPALPSAHLLLSPPTTSPAVAYAPCSKAALTQALAFTPYFNFDAAVKHCLSANSLLLSLLRGQLPSLPLLLTLRILHSLAVVAALLLLIRVASILCGDGDRDVPRLLFACALASIAWFTSSIASTHASFQMQVLQLRISSVLRVAIARKIHRMSPQARLTASAAKYAHFICVQAFQNVF